MYGIVTGRVRFFTETDGHVVMTADAGPGITFGEGALLVGGGRSRTAVVARDALLVRVPPEHFHTLMTVARGRHRGRRADRRPLRRHARPGRTSRHGPAVVAVDVAAGRRRRRLVRRAARRGHGFVRRPGVHGRGARAPMRRPPRSRTIRAAERWARRADVVLLLRDGGRPPHELETTATPAGRASTRSPRHPASWCCCGDPARHPPPRRWSGAAAFEFAACHHVRRGIVDRRHAHRPPPDRARRSPSCSAEAAPAAWHTSACSGRSTSWRSPSTTSAGRAWVRSSAPRPRWVGRGARSSTRTSTCGTGGRCVST